MHGTLAITLLVTLAFASPAAAGRSRAPVAPERIEAMLKDPARHVRAVHPDIATLLERGARRSYTMAHLLEALERSDVYVFIEVAPRLPIAVAGRLLYAGTSHGHRFIRIQIARHGTQEDMIATVAHELQHAVEVAEAPEVQNELSLAALYNRIGHLVNGSGSYDTMAAREAGRSVRGELG